MDYATVSVAIKRLAGASSETKGSEIWQAAGLLETTLVIREIRGSHGLNRIQRSDNSCQRLNRQPTSALAISSSSIN